MPLKHLHAWNARNLGAFLLVHFANHTALYFGRETHLAVMEGLRGLYRHPFIEWPLFALFAVQIVLGLALILRRGRPRGGWAWAQVLSGIIIALFVLQHLGAVLYVRTTYEFETTTYWAASVVSAPPLVWYFAPYYVAGITAVFVHVAAAFRFAIWPDPPRMWHRALPFAGLCFALSVVSALSWGAHEALPAENRAYLQSMYGGQ